MYLVDCVWNDWVLGECSEACGPGTQTNTRTKLTVEDHGGVCEGEETMQEECNVQDCPRTFFRIFHNKFKNLVKYGLMIAILIMV